MKFRLPIICAIVLFTTCLQGAEYQITLRADGEKVAVIDLLIIDDTAIARTGEIVELFDLKKQRWQKDQPGQWVTLAESEKWAAESKAKSLKSQESIPEDLRPFVLWSLNPTFAVKATDNSLTLDSSQVTYRIVGTKAEDLTNYFRFARLNAYKKAMTLRQIPPFAELLAIDEMEKSGIRPTSMKIEIPGIPGSPTIEMTITAKDKAVRSNASEPAESADTKDRSVSEELSKDIQAIVATLPASDHRHVERYLRDGPPARGDTFVTANLAKNALNGTPDRDPRIAMSLARVMIRLAQEPSFPDDTREYAFAKVTRLAQRSKEVAGLVTPVITELSKREKDLLKERAAQYLKK